MPCGVILLGTAGTNVPSLHNFLEILSGNGPEYASNNTGYFSPSCECYFIGDKAPTMPSSSRLQT